MPDDEDSHPPGWDARDVERTLLAVPNRRRIAEHVRRHPAVHLRQVARDLDLAVGTVEHHLHLLERHGLVQRRRAAGHACYFAAGRDAVDARDWRLVTVLRRRPQRLILRALGAQATLGLPELASRCGMSPAAAAYHVRALLAAGHIEALRLGARRLLRATSRQAVAGALLAFDDAQPAPRWPGLVLQVAPSAPRRDDVRPGVKDRPPHPGPPSNLGSDAVPIAAGARSNRP